ncbi:MAG TPA: DolP-mannose mannosyltransferase [Blastocatellia bacterium]|nr:DolP-mannose mannosyltransferase [Blastocatellia bacterium]
MSDVAVPSETRARTFDLSKWLNLVTRRHVFWLCFALAIIVYSQLHFWNWVERRDPANWDYFSQVISRGGVPYKDVVNIKTPLSAYIGAAAILISKPFGLRDIYAIRITYTILAALTIAFTFLVASYFFESLRIGLLAALIILGVERFPLLSLSGAQPKTPMILFGLIALWAVIKDRPFLAGMFGMLSALSWQPGLLFVGAAGLGFSKYLTSWRDLKVAKLLAGAAVPLVLLLTHLWIGGAVKDFYNWCFHYPFNVYGPREYTTGQGFFDRFSKLIEKPYASDRIYFYLSVAGLLLAIAREVTEGIKHGFRAVLQLAPRHQIIIAALVYFIFCRIDLQGEQDLIPMLPFVAIFASVLMIYSLDAVMKLDSRLRGVSSLVLFQRIGFVIICAVVLFAGLTSVFSARTPPKRLKAQLADAAALAALLEPGDNVFVHGRTEILVLTGLPNSRKYTNLDHGKDNYLNQVEPGGFEGWFEQLKAERPKVISLSRMKGVDHKKELVNWAESEYEGRKGKVLSYYVRKD